MTAHKKVCALCGRRIKHDETYTYSRFTRNYYCGPKQKDLCNKRRKKGPSGS